MSYSSTSFRASKLNPSIFVCADSSDRVISEFSIGSSSGIPKRPIIFFMVSEAKTRMRVSQATQKTACHPDRPAARSALEADYRYAALRGARYQAQRAPPELLPPLFSPFFPPLPPPFYQPP